MKITVIGAAGNMARSGVLDLVESSDVKAIQLVDINVKFLEKLRVALKSKKVSTAEVDITDQKSLVRTVKGSNVVMKYRTLRFYVMILCQNYLFLGIRAAHA